MTETTWAGWILDAAVLKNTSTLPKEQQTIATEKKSHSHVCTEREKLICCPLCTQGNLTHPELSVAVEMLSSVALINRALDSGDVNTVWKQLSSPVTGLTNIEDENSQRWIFQGIMSVLDVAYIL